MSRLPGLTALGLILSVTPALADMSPAQSWEAISAYYDGFGMQISEGARDVSGDMITLRDVVLSSRDDSAGSMRITIPAISLAPTGDGNTRMRLPEPISMVVEADSAGELAKIRAEMGFAKGEVTISGQPEDIVFDYVMPQSTLALIEVVADGETVPMPISLTLKDVKGQEHVRQGNRFDFTQAMTAARVEIDGKGQADDGETFTVSGGFDDLSLQSQGSLPRGGDVATQMGKMLADGGEIKGEIKIGRGQSSAWIDGEADFSGGLIDAQTAGSTLRFALSEKGVSYGGDFGKITVNMQFEDAPFPINYSLNNGAFELTAPIIKSDEPQPFKIDYSISGLTFGDGLWSMIDPTARLPRKPADLKVAFSGMATVLEDVFDPAYGAKYQKLDDPDLSSEEFEALLDELDTPPFMPNSVKIDEVAISALGAKIDVTGALDFPNGPDAPVGKVSANFEGVNALLQTLGQIGLPAEQLMGARMMLMMFATPGEGEDSLKGEFEFTQDGHIFANGQQVK